MKKFTGITNKYLKVQKRRTILTITGVLLAVSLITTIFTLYLSLNKSLVDSTKQRDGEYHFKITNTRGSLINKIKNNNDVEKIGIKENKKTALISKVLDKEKEYDPNAPDYRTMTISSVNDENYKLIPINLLEGRKPENENEIVIFKTAILFLDENLKLGDKINLSILEGKYNGKSFKEDYKKEYTIVGILDSEISTSTNYYLYGITYLDINSISDNNFYDVYIKLYSPDKCKDKANSIYNNLEIKKIAKNEGLESNISYNTYLLKYQLESENEMFNESMIIVLGIVVLLIIISSIAVIYNAFNISVLEKIRQFGILRCIGASPNQIKKIVLKEASIIGGIGIPAGIILGIIVSKIMLIFLINYASFINMDLVLDINIYVILFSAILGIITVYISAFGPVRQAAKVSPVEAVRNIGNIKSEKIKRTKNIKKYWFIKKIFKIEGQLAFKNLKRNRKRYRVTLFSMVISIVLYLFFVGLADNLYGASDFLNEEMGDFSVGIKDSKRDFSDEIINKIRNFEEIDSVYEIQKGRLNTQKGKEILLKDNKNIKKVDIVSFGNDGLNDLKKYLVEGSINNETLSDENSVILIKTTLLNEVGKRKYVEKLDYEVGDTINLNIDKKEHKVKVAAIVEKGIFYGYTFNSENNLIMMSNQKVFKNLFGESKLNGIILLLKDSKKNDLVSKKLDELFIKYPEYTYTNYSENANNVVRILNVMRIFLYGFVIIIAIISILNIINTISTNLILRTQEISIYKAIGMTKSGIKKITFYEALFYGINATIYGTIITLGILMLIGIYTKKIIEIENPFGLPFLQIFIVSIFSIIISVIAGFIPLKRINDKAIMENIRGEE